MDEGHGTDHERAQFHSLLGEASEGNQDALARILPIVYEELHRIASAYLRRERPDHTLQTTALVHEAYLRLAGQDELGWKNRAHFRAIAAQTMRRILIEHARARGRQKRGGAPHRVVLHDDLALAASPGIDLEAIDHALTRLQLLDPQQARIVELRFFAGLTVEETAEVLSISKTTVKRDWAMARAWLRRELEGGA
ncbi:MAG TPA: sigma-70 family RNA polymerase sigma factor [Vicinamibacterales bacterium]|jgi:RNA polymerase sigma factor (TIGR02999 family)